MNIDQKTAIMQSRQTIADEPLSPRIVQCDGKRLCIRLEKIYWDVFEEMAQDQSCKFNELVHKTYNDPLGGKNKTAYLRRVAVQWLSHKVDKANQKLAMDSSELKAVLKVTNQPALVFSEVQSVSRHNKSFRDWLCQQLATADRNVDYSKVRVSFRRSYKAIMELLGPGGGSLMDEQAAILMPGYVFPIRLNLVLLHDYSEKDQLFLGILQTD